MQRTNEFLQLINEINYIRRKILTMCFINQALEVIRRAVSAASSIQISNLQHQQCF